MDGRSRCVAATGSWWRPAGATSSSSTTRHRAAAGSSPGVLRRPAIRHAAYVELHCHSAYSFLDGVSLPESWRTRGRAGLRALALTDHNSVSGSMELAQAAADTGCGRSTAPRSTWPRPPAAGPAAHITLLVRDERGWSNLCRILTLAHAHTRDGPGGACSASRRWTCRRCSTTPRGSSA